MSRLTMIYDGKEADKLTKDELINAILNEFFPAVFTDFKLKDEVIRCMEESFRCGFLRGEEYSTGKKV